MNNETKTDDKDISIKESEYTTLKHNADVYLEQREHFRALYSEYKELAEDILAQYAVKKIEARRLKDELAAKDAK